MSQKIELPPNPSGTSSTTSHLLRRITTGDRRITIRPIPLSQTHSIALIESYQFRLDIQVCAAIVLTVFLAAHRSLNSKGVISLRRTSGIVTDSAASDPVKEADVIMTAVPAGARDRADARRRADPRRRHRSRLRNQSDPRTLQ
jgi:hypothetical protein